MVVAGSLSPKSKSSLSPEEERWQEAVSSALASGHSIATIANKLARGDRQRYYYNYGKVRRLAQRDAIFQAKIQQKIKAEALIESGSATKGAIRRAKRGRMDAVKFVLGMAGVYNEKVSHEHGGSIEINVSIPRPPPVEDRLGIEEPIVDADVVEDD